VVFRRQRQQLAAAQAEEVTIGRKNKMKFCVKEFSGTDPKLGSKYLITWGVTTGVLRIVSHAGQRSRMAQSRYARVYTPNVAYAIGIKTRTFCSLL
jgi:hypothetical protein